MKDRTIKLYNFIKEFWFLIKMFIEIPPNNDQDAWDYMVDQAGALEKKYRSDDAEGKFVTACVVAWLSYLNDRVKEVNP